MHTLKLSPADIIAKLPELYAGLRDKCGEEYWRHPLSVMKLLPDDAGDDVKIAALLHDILEDTPAKPEDLAMWGVPETSLEMIKLLTHDKRTPYEEYIGKLLESDNRGAILVKCADLEHNLDGNRLSALETETRQRLELKYRPVYERIKRLLNAEDVRSK